MHLSAREKKLDNTTIVKIPERLLRMRFIEKKWTWASKEESLTC